MASRASGAPKVADAENAESAESAEGFNRATTVCVAMS
jgi:hypothetical protein